MKDGKFKSFLLKIWEQYVITKKWLALKKNLKFRILNSEETIEYIKKNKCSISRYGDGEFNLMYSELSEDYQTFSHALSDALVNVLNNHNKNLLICIPRPMVSQKNLKKHAKKFWKTWMIENHSKITRRILDQTGKNYLFGDSFVSRPYTAYKSKKYTEKIFESLKTLWKDQEILIVEGALTRLGIGNDLFSNAKSIKRILAPSENAFDNYSQILQTIIEHWSGELVIMALGPTATVLASDLSKNNIQALDLGHVDIQYEWFLNGNDFEPIKGKYTNEAKDKIEISDCHDKDYLSQIIVDLTSKPS